MIVLPLAETSEFSCDGIDSMLTSLYLLFPEKSLDGLLCGYLSVLWQLVQGFGQKGFP